MMKDFVSRYVRNLFAESRDGSLSIGDADDRFEVPVEWDRQTADALAQQCGTLVGHLTELSCQFDKLCCGTQHLTSEQLEVWNTYLRPFPDHNLDSVALEAVWEKIEIEDPVTQEEWSLFNQYVQWYSENAQSRLPFKCCKPDGLMSRARRYCRLVQLKAPVIVQENEVQRLAEEFVLYHCMKKAHDDLNK